MKSEMEDEIQALLTDARLKIEQAQRLVGHERRERRTFVAAMLDERLAIVLDILPDRVSL